MQAAIWYFSDKYVLSPTDAAFSLTQGIVNHVRAEGRGGLADLAVDGQLEQVEQLLGLETVIHEVELHRGLLDPLGEVLLVEREAKLAVLEHVVRAGFVITPAGCLFH